MSAVTPPRLLEWRPLRKGSLYGFAKVQFGSGLIVAEIGVHRAGSRIWAAPPARPWVKDNVVVVNEITGKPQYTRVIEFVNHGTRASWSRQVLATLLDAHPEALEVEEARVAAP